MGSLDTPPPDCPSWLVPLHTALLGLGVLLWDATYILMTRRALASQSYGMPLLALASNVSWELVYLFYVCDMPLETVGFLFWLILDVGLVYTTVRFGEEDWRMSRTPWVGRHIASILALLVLAGCVVHYRFAAWWLAAPHMGTGMKHGKWWGGREGYDTTELAFWSAGVCQAVLGASSLAMLANRGHSGGTSYAIWFCRAMGTVLGLVLDNIVMWWYWPEPHGFIFSLPGVLLWGTAIACDAVYPFLLWRVRRREVILPSGRLARGGGDHEKKRQ